jgi:ribosomal-protein-alanine N-acetyltransferase
METERLRLRAWRDEDRAPFAALNADPVVMEHFPGVLSREESDAGVDRLIAAEAAHGATYWATERKSDGAFIGFIGIKPVPFEAHFTPAWDIGWRLARAYWGQGYASEGAAAARDFGFQEIGLKELVSITVPGNLRSQAVMRKIGMVRDEAGDFDHPMLDEGHPLRRHVLYRMQR